MIFRRSQPATRAGAARIGRALSTPRRGCLPPQPLPRVTLVGVARPSRPVPPPFEGADQLITGIITAGWAIALLVLVLARGQLPAPDHWWIWTCVVGIGIGLFGLAYVPQLKKSRRRAAARREQARPAPGG